MCTIAVFVCTSRSELAAWAGLSLVSAVSVPGSRPSTGALKGRRDRRGRRQKSVAPVKGMAASEGGSTCHRVIAAVEPKITCRRTKTHHRLSLPLGAQTSTYRLAATSSQEGALAA